MSEPHHRKKTPRLVQGEGGGIKFDQRRRNLNQMRQVYKDEFRMTVKNPSVGKNTERNSNVLAFRALRDCKHNRLKNEIRLQPS